MDYHLTARNRISFFRILARFGKRFSNKRRRRGAAQRGAAGIFLCVNVRLSIPSFRLSGCVYYVSVSVRERERESEREREREREGERVVVRTR